MRRYKEVIKRKKNVTKCHSIDFSAYSELNGELDKIWVEEIDPYFKTLSVYLTERADGK
jgi:hypothetical protein